MQVLMIVHHKWFRLLHGCQFAGCVDLIHALHFPSIVNDPKRTALFDDETVVVLRDGMLHRFCEFRKGRQNCSVLLDDICAFVIVYLLHHNPNMGRCFDAAIYEEALVCRFFLLSFLL